MELVGGGSVISGAYPIFSIPYKGQCLGPLTAQEFSSPWFSASIEEGSAGLAHNDWTAANTKLLELHYSALIHILKCISAKLQQVSISHPIPW